jgi:hypothetical protein
MKPDETKFAVEDVEPIGTRTTFAHVNTTDPRTHGFRNIDLPVYPDTSFGDALRAARVGLGYGLRAASRALGIPAVDLSGVESGSKRFRNLGDYVRAVDVLRCSSQKESAGARGTDSVPPGSGS